MLNLPSLNIYLIVVLQGSENKHISKDTWKMTADFAKANTGPTPAALARNYDESAIENWSWPVLLDDFVEHCQKAAASS